MSAAKRQADIVRDSTRDAVLRGIRGTFNDAEDEDLIAGIHAERAGQAVFDKKLAGANQAEADRVARMRQARQEVYRTAGTRTGRVAGNRIVFDGSREREDEKRLWNSKVLV